MYVAFDSAAGSASKPNEDFVAASSSVAVVLDGLTAAPVLGTSCAHGTPWFVAQLGGHLLSSATTQRDKPLGVPVQQSFLTSTNLRRSVTCAPARLSSGDPLPEIAADAITRVADAHRYICDLEDPGTPACSVAIVREGDQGLDYLVLFDSVIVLDGPSDLKVVTDRRIDAVALDEDLATRAHPIGSDEHQSRVHKLITAQRRSRNQPGGYWVAAANPGAAYEAVTGSLPRPLVTRAALLSDGVSCLVERYAIGDWRWLLTVLQRHGPRYVISRVREAEHTDPAGARWPRYKRSDDATAAFCLLS